MKLLLVTILVQIGIWNISLGQSVDSLNEQITIIDGRVVIIDENLTTLGGQISEINAGIGALQVQIDPINDAITAIDDQLDVKNGEITVKQDLIDQKADERDALPEGDPQIAILQGEINTLVSERDALQAEVDQLLLDKQAQLDLKAPLQAQVDAKQLEKDELLAQETGYENEKSSLLENKRQHERHIRILGCPDLRLCMVESGLNQPNAKLFKKDLIVEEDDTPTSRIKRFEAAIPAVIAKLAEEENKKNAKAAARLYIKNLDPATVTDETLKQLIIMLQ